MFLDIFYTVFKYKEKATPDRLGAYPERVHVNAMPERRYLWASRFLVILSCLSICMSMMLAMTIYLLLPQRGAYPRLLQRNDYFSQLEFTDPAEKYVPAYNLIAEQYIEEYIMLRHVISNDYDELMSRWAPGAQLYWLSSSNVFKRFANLDVAENIKKFRSQELVRLVEVEWIRPMAKGLWAAQFITMDYLPDNEKPVINIWRAYLRTTFTTINYENYRQRAMNPYGFLILNYSLSYVGNPDKPESYLNTAKDVRNQVYPY